uniref:Uncharacterized protein n=1 Tax=Oryza glumipatula TaxID=40148 RepID=A0A0E0BJE2_9ORYZ
MSAGDAVVKAEKRPSTIYRMGQEQIDGILSWDLPATDYEPVFVGDDPSYSDEKRERYRRLVLRGNDAKNKLLHKMRELQDYVKNQLALHGYVDIDEKMHYPS